MTELNTTTNITTTTAASTTATEPAPIKEQAQSQLALTDNAGTGERAGENGAATKIMRLVLEVEVAHDMTQDDLGEMPVPLVLTYGQLRTLLSILRERHYADFKSATRKFRATRPEWRKLDREAANFQLNTTDALLTIFEAVKNAYTGGKPSLDEIVVAVGVRTPRHCLCRCHFDPAFEQAPDDQFSQGALFD